MTAKRYEWWRVSTLGGMLLLCLGVTPALGGEVEDRIRALEAQQRANAEELAQLKGEQMELKKEATAAAAALPTFTYRPGAGVTIAAADRSWEWRISYQIQGHIYNAIKGDDARGSTTGDIFFRRNRLYLNFWQANGLLEWVLTQDFDTEDIAGEQNSSVRLHLETINPWLPTFMVSDADRLVSPRGFERSSTSSARVEDFALDMLSDSHVDILSYRGLTLGWLDKPVLTGDATFIAAYKPEPGVNRNNEKDTDRTGLALAARVRPFTRTKNPWLERLGIGYGFQFDSNDSRSTANAARLRLRTSERGRPRVTLFDANNIGDGNHTWHGNSLVWGYGPYNFAAGGTWSRFASGRSNAGSDGFKGVDGNAWEVAHELFLWSPKGFLTGTPTTPNSLLLGYSFRRADADCGRGGDCSPGTGSFHRNHLTLNEVDLWYFIMPAFRVGLWWNEWESANTPTGTQAQIGCRSNTKSTLGRGAGRDCTWNTVNLGFQTQF